MFHKLCFIFCFLISLQVFGLTELYVDNVSTGNKSGSDPNNFMDWDNMTGSVHLGTTGTTWAGYRFNVKGAGHTYARSGGDTLIADGTAVSPIIIRGYNITPGDLDSLSGTASRTNGTGPLITANYPVINYVQNVRLTATGADDLILECFVITCAGTGNTGAVINISGTNGTCYRCSVSNISTDPGAIAITGNQVIDCDAKLMGTSGGTAAISGIRVIGCHVTQSSANGINLTTAPGTAVSNVVDNCTAGNGISLTGTATQYAFFWGNTVANCLRGLSVGNNAYTAAMIFGNNHITDCGTSIYSGYSATANLAGVFLFNRTRDNGNDVTGFTNWLASTDWGLVTTDTGDNTTDFMASDTGDFRLVHNAPGIRSGFPTYTDIGALQANPDFPDAIDVIDNDTTDTVAGLYTVVGGSEDYPPAYAVLDNETTDSVPGTLTLPLAAQVSVGVHFGPDNATVGSGGSLTDMQNICDAVMMLTPSSTGAVGSLEDRLTTINGSGSGIATDVNLIKIQTDKLRFTGTYPNTYVQSDAIDIGGVAAYSATIGTVLFVSGVNVTQWDGVDVATPNVAGYPMVDLGYVGGTAASSAATIDSNITQIGGADVNTSLAQLGVNVVNIAGTASAGAAGSIRADNVTGSVGSVTGAVGSVTGSVGSVTSAVTITSNSDITAIKSHTDNLTFTANTLVKSDVVDIGGTASAGHPGYTALDWGHIYAPATTANLTGTTIQTVAGNVNGSVDNITKFNPLVDSVMLTAAYNAAKTASSFNPATDTVTLKSGTHTGAIIPSVTTVGTVSGSVKNVTDLTGDTIVASLKNSTWLIGTTFDKTMKVLAAMIAGKMVESPKGTITYYDTDGTTPLLKIYYTSSGRTVNWSP